MTDHHRYVYILAVHDEYGSEECVATLDRTKLHDLMERHWPENDSWPDRTEWMAEAQAALAKLLENSDADLVGKIGAFGSKRELHRGWGGMHLFVLPIDIAAPEWGLSA